MALLGKCISVDDPRDNLDKARQMELVRFAQQNGLKHITEQMPAILIRAELRQRNLTNIRIPRRPLGGMAMPPALAPAVQTENAVSVDAAADLARQFAQQRAQPEPAQPAPKPASKSKYPQRLVERPKSEINKLRDECKRLGIKMERRDRMDDLRAKIAAHGQNAPELR